MSRIRSTCCPTTASRTRSSIRDSSRRTISRRRRSHARPLWEILADYGIASGIVNWPLTRPARAIRGYVLSDRFDEAASSPLRLGDAQAGDPTTAMEIARETFDVWQERPWQEVMPRCARQASRTPSEIRLRDGTARITEAALGARGAVRAAVDGDSLRRARHFGHCYLSDAQPELFGDRRSAEPAALAARPLLRVHRQRSRPRRWRLTPGDLLLVVSGFGMEPTALGKRLVRARCPAPRPHRHRMSRAPDGFLVAYGTNVARLSSAAAQSSISRRRSCTTWACASAGIWTALRAPTSFATQLHARVEHQRYGHVVMRSTPRRTERSAQMS